MCEFFSCVATRDGRLLFTEEDSHEVIIDRAHLRDGDLHLRTWVRVEVNPQGEGWGPVWVDETSTPAWWDEDRAAWEGRVLALASRVRPAQAACQAAKQQAWAAYKAGVEQAWAAYKAVEEQAWAAYQAVEEPAQAACQAAKQQAWAAYQAVEEQAWAAYISHLRSIEGYVPEEQP